MVSPTALIGVGLDMLLGEPRRHHPLVWFGSWARLCEERLYGGVELNDSARRQQGVIALVVAVVPVAALAAMLSSISYLGVLVDIVLLYLAIGYRSLNDHAQAVATALQADDLEGARVAVGRIVSRDCSDLDETGVSRAAVESVLENGNDAIFAALFWFVIAGAPGVVFYRLVNTLDAMWGYRNERYNMFGWAAARLDDLLNYIPARLTAWSYALAGDYGRAMRCWRTQAPYWKSPNAGPVMAAGAGALGVSLGGAASYHGEIQQRPSLGEGPEPRVGDIERTNALVSRVLYGWLIVILAGAVLNA